MTTINLIPNEIIEISPLRFKELSQYTINNLSDNEIYMWLGVNNPKKGNETGIIEPRELRIAFFRGQQILVMSTKPTTIEFSAK